MIRGSVTVRKVFDITRRTGEKIGKEAEHAVARAALGIENQVKTNIVSNDLVDTGFMLNSVHAEQISAALWRVTVGAEYGIYHEFSTRFMPARPFFYSAAELWFPRLRDELRRLKT